MPVKDLTFKISPIKSPSEFLDNHSMLSRFYSTGARVGHNFSKVEHILGNDFLSLSTVEAEERLSSIGEVAYFEPMYSYPSFTGHEYFTKSYLESQLILPDAYAQDGWAVVFNKDLQDMAGHCEHEAWQLIGSISNALIYDGEIYLAAQKKLIFDVIISNSSGNSYEFINVVCLNNFTVTTSAEPMTHDIAIELINRLRQKLGNKKFMLPLALSRG